MYFEYHKSEIKAKYANRKFVLNRLIELGHIDAATYFLLSTIKEICARFRTTIMYWWKRTHDK